jgi:hypothetical protein
MNSSTRLALLLGLQVAAGAAFLACGGDDKDPAPATGGSGGDGGTPTASTDNGGLAFVTTPLYSAYVPSHEAQVPIVIKDASRRKMGAKFTSKDPSIATVVDTDDGALVTVKKDGKVVISGSLEGDTGNVTINIKAYTDEQWTTGSNRFSKTDLAIMPKDGSAPSAIALLDSTTRNPNGACNTCHTSQAKTLGIENGPLQIAGYTDDDLITIFTMGKKPDGAKQASMIPSFIWGMFHEWTVTEEEKAGLIAFLRTQTPKANGTIDYGVYPCGDAGGMLSQNTPICDKNGKPIMFGGGRDGGASRGGTDAGTSTTDTDAGTSTTTPDAGTSTTGDAG